MAKRAQAGLEYLMTYGWALVVIVVVIGALMWLFSSAKPPEYCSAPPGFKCDEPLPLVYPDTGGNLIVNATLVNYKNTKITLEEALCVIGGPSPSIPTGVSWNAISADLNPGESETFSASCYDQDGQAVTGSPGQTVKGTLFVKYKYPGDSADRVMDLSFTVTVGST